MTIMRLFMKINYYKIYKYLKSSTLISLAILTAFPFHTYAATDDFIDKFAANNIMFYNPD